MLLSRKRNFSPKELILLNKSMISLKELAKFTIRVIFSMKPHPNKFPKLMKILNVLVGAKELTENHCLTVST